ncbi:MAG TPA: TRAP transporter small permease [Thermohalobaculum sp.]|nr:TRAP transporter small permease [Thermohalobaculum sp.]
MKLLSHLLERVALAVLLVGGLGMLMSMFLGVADVIGTQMLHIPVPGPYEITESTMVLIVFGALAYAQIRRAHIRVELIYTHMGPRVQAAMDILADVAAIVFFGLMLWQAKMEAEYSYQINERTVGLVRFPLYPARIVLAAGTALLILRLALDLIVDIRRIFTGEALELPEPLVPELRSGNPDQEG